MKDKKWLNLANPVYLNYEYDKKILEEWQKNCLGCIYFDEEARTKSDASCTNVNEKETDATGKVCLSFVLKKS